MKANIDNYALDYYDLAVFTVDKTSDSDVIKPLRPRRAGGRAAILARWLLCPVGVGVCARE